MSHEKEHPGTEAIIKATEVIAEREVAEDIDRLAQLTFEELAVECRQAQQTADENWDKAVRTQAEMENLRRRVERDVASAHKFGIEKILKELLAVVDSIQSGLDIGKNLSGDAKAIHEGMELTLKLLLDTLKKNGVQEIDPMGHPFDTAEMEAVSAQPGTQSDPNTVINVLQKGYKLHERLLRPAMVIIAQ
ncbi:MAG: nucleotide exchange factor GrpE [Gammaproteobacteria bacterium]|nr:nucleotide exchange factor GrpE [Gammaproteobacteria bacterium]